MTAFLLKIIASCCMLIDHVGAVFYFVAPSFFRSIGRTAFPIYAYFIAEGCTHTKNINKYMLRLFMFAFISEIPFDLAFGWSLQSQAISILPLPLSFIKSTNVFYSLALGVACINIYEKNKYIKNRIITLIPMLLIPFAVLAAYRYNSTMSTAFIALYALVSIVLSILLPAKEQRMQNSSVKLYVPFKNKLLAIIPAIPIISLGELLSADYGSFAVIWIILLYLAGTKRNRIIVLTAGIFYLYGLPLIPNIGLINFHSLLSLAFALSAVILLLLYNGKQGRRMKWLFYWFYPAHLAALAFIWLIFARPVINGL